MFSSITSNFVKITDSFSETLPNPESSRKLNSRLLRVFLFFTCFLQNHPSLRVLYVYCKSSKDSVVNGKKNTIPESTVSPSPSYRITGRTTKMNKPSLFKCIQYAINTVRIANSWQLLNPDKHYEPCVYLLVD